MKKFFLIAVITIASFAILLIIGGFSPQRHFGNNMVFHIASNYDGSRIALNSTYKVKTGKWSLHLAKDNLNLISFNPNEDVIFEGSFIFGDHEDEFFYTGSKNNKYGLWKGNFSTGESKNIFETEKIISYPYIINNGDVYFIGNNLTSKNHTGWDWFRYSPSKGIEQITNKNYYFFQKPCIISETFLGFTQRYDSIIRPNPKDPKNESLYIESLTLKKDSEAELILKNLENFIVSSDSQAEPDIVCSKKGTVCAISKTVLPKGKTYFQHEIFILDQSKTRKINTNLVWKERFTLSGNGNHLFLVGSHGALSEKYFLQKYSRNADGDFVLVEEKDLSFIKPPQA